MKKSAPKISLVAAVANHGIIGYKNKIPWHLPRDLQRFKQLTLKKPIIMGRKTYESIGHALPGRENIVLTHQEDFLAAGCLVVHSIERAIECAIFSKMFRNVEEIMVIGGASIYKQFLPLAENFYLTRIHHKFLGDTFFPAWNPEMWEEVVCESYEPDHENIYRYEFILMKKKQL